MTMDLDTSLQEILTSWTPSSAQDVIGENLERNDSQSIETLFHDSFNVWGEFDNPDLIQLN